MPARPLLRSGQLPKTRRIRHSAAAMPPAPDSTDPNAPEKVTLPTGTKPVEARHALDEARLEAFLQREIPEFEGPLALEQFRGGQSNPTYQITSPQGRWVLRRKPPGKLVRGAHAVDREFRVLSALQQVDFPSPRPRVLCDDDEVIGSMFYVMDAVDGRVETDLMLPEYTPEQRAGIYDSMNEILAKLHRVDFEAIGLGDYGRPGNYFERQINTWTKQIRASGFPEVPEVEKLVEWLPRNVPDDASVSIAHGDYGLNNMLVHPSEPRIVAILDWELSTIGHPLADLTYHLAARHNPSGEFRSLSDEALRARGIPSADEYVARYCKRTGRDGIERLEFYLAFHQFRMAAILQGIAGRVARGTAAGEGAEKFGAMVRPLAQSGLEFAAKIGA